MRERFLEEKDRETIGWIKRFLEYEAMIPGFCEEVEKDPAFVMQKYGFPLTPEDVSFYPQEPGKPRRMKPRFPDSKAPVYEEFMDRKYRHIEQAREACSPANEPFKKWREMQMARCILDLGPQYTAVIHAPLMFELSIGCSVGCEFCGLNAGKLQEVYRYTDENAALFREILQRAKELIGPAAGEGTLYFASEPLDNPDYEKFMHDFRDIMGILPQITTATSSRHIERLRPLLKELNEDGRSIYRFSILSEEMYRQVTEAFSPADLALVELLPQYEEAPGNHFASAGRYAASHQGDEEVSGSITCITGFLVNMCKHTITLTTPTWAREGHENGQYILGVEEFRDAGDFGAKLEMMIDKYMKTYLSPKDVICMYPYLSYRSTDDAVMIESKHGTGYRLMAKDQEELIGKLFELAALGCYTRREIVQEIVKAKQFPAVQSEFLFYLINRYYAKGIFVEKGSLLS